MSYHYLLAVYKPQPVEYDNAHAEIPKAKRDQISERPVKLVKDIFRDRYTTE